MVYLGVNSNNGSSSSSGQNKNGSRSPDLVDIDTDKPNDRNGGNYLCNLFREKNKDFTSSDNKTKVKPWLFYVLASNGTDSRDHNQITVSRDSRDDREDSGSEDDSKGTIRVGRDFQVITPSWVPPERKKLLFTNRIISMIIA